jgi:hypothetical protein
LFLGSEVHLKTVHAGELAFSLRIGGREGWRAQRLRVPSFHKYGNDMKGYKKKKTS